MGYSAIFRYLSLFSDPIDLETWRQRELLNYARFNSVGDTKTSFIQMGPNKHWLENESKPLIIFRFLRIPSPISIMGVVRGDLLGPTSLIFDILSRNLKVRFGCICRTDHFTQLALPSKEVLSIVSKIACCSL